MSFTVLETITPSRTPEPDEILLKAASTRQSYQPTTVKFNPSLHLNIEEPAWRKKLSEFGYDNEKDGISEIGATAAFQLFTEEAVILMRNDLFSEPVQENHVFSTERAPYQVRGFTPSKSKFIYDAWNCPQVLDAISKAAGIELVPQMDYEIGHTNIQLGSKGPAGVRELGPIPSLPLPDSEQLPPSQYDSRPVDNWHYDGTPFVAVHMLSNTNGMRGGETAVMGRNGEINIVPGPAMGKVVVMQGSCLKHAALRSMNCPERIAMVTSLRPKNPFVYDMSHLRNVWECSDRQQIGYDWLKYRFKVLEDRLKSHRESLTTRWSPESEKHFSKSLRDYLQKTIDEISLDNSYHQIYN